MHPLARSANEVDRLRQALMPFAKAREHFPADENDDTPIAGGLGLKVGHLTDARMALAKNGGA